MWEWLNICYLQIQFQQKIKELWRK